MLLLKAFEKAFDSVSWSVINNTIAFLSFGEDIRKWFNVLYNGARFCLTISGILSPRFLVEWCRRQADHVSPYIFILFVEVLTGLIRKKKRY